MTEERIETVCDRLAHLETTVQEQQEIIERQQQTIEEFRCQSELSIDRRSALQAGGILGLLGLGATTASGTASGQIGTADRPVAGINAEDVATERLEATELDGPVVQSDAPISALYPTGTNPETVPLFVDDGSGTAVLEFPDDQAQLNVMGFGGVAPAAVGDGAIVETETDDDGGYVRWESGYQVCWQRDFSCDYENTARYTSDWSFPAVFDAAPVCIATASSSSDIESVSGRWDNFGVVHCSANSGSSANVRVYSGNGNSFSESDRESVTLNLLANGTWK